MNTTPVIYFIHIDKGVGTGIVVGGRIVCGFSGLAGERTYMVNNDDMWERGHSLAYERGLLGIAVPKRSLKPNLNRNSYSVVVFLQKRS